MLIEYEHYKLKEGTSYPFYGEDDYSEIIYNNKDESIFEIVDPDTMFLISIDKLLQQGYFDQYNPNIIKEIFQGIKPYFIYDEEEEKYCMKVLFTEEEKNKLSTNFSSILIKVMYKVNNEPLPKVPHYIALEDVYKQYSIDGLPDTLPIETFWLYTLKFSKEQLKQIKKGQAL